jgi:hypothetical protein
MGACGSKDAIQLVDAPAQESPPEVKAPVVVEKKKEPEKVEPPAEETEENPGYEVPAMVSAAVFVFFRFRALDYLVARRYIDFTMTIGSF